MKKRISTYPTSILQKAIFALIVTCIPFPQALGLQTRLVRSANHRSYYNYSVTHVQQSCTALRNTISIYYNRYIAPHKTLFTIIAPTAPIAALLYWKFRQPITPTTTVTPGPLPTPPNNLTPPTTPTAHSPSPQQQTTLAQEPSQPLRPATPLPLSPPSSPKRPTASLQLTIEILAENPQETLKAESDDEDLYESDTETPTDTDTRSSTISSIVPSITPSAVPLIQYDPVHKRAPTLPPTTSGTAKLTDEERKRRAQKLEDEFQAEAQRIAFEQLKITEPLARPTFAALKLWKTKHMTTPGQQFRILLGLIGHEYRNWKGTTKKNLHWFPGIMVTIDDHPGTIEGIVCTPHTDKNTYHYLVCYLDKEQQYIFQLVDIAHADHLFTIYQR